MSASSSGFARLNLATLAVLFLLAGAAVGLAIEAVAPAPGRRVKMVEVVVAARDLHLGTPFTKDNIDELTTTKMVPKESLPKNCVTSKNDLLDKRLYRMAHKGDFFATADVKGKPHVTFNAGRDHMSLPISTGWNNGFVGPGCRVDIIAIFNDGNQRDVFTLLPDIHVLEVTHGDNNRMSFAVDAKQAAIVTLANQANCSFELMLRHPDSPHRDFDYDATLARVKGLVKSPDSKAKPELIVAPTPHIKPSVEIKAAVIAPLPRAKPIDNAALPVAPAPRVKNR